MSLFLKVLGLLAIGFTIGFIGTALNIPLFLTLIVSGVVGFIYGGKILRSEFE